jgi:hypothetical protein
MLPCPNCGEKCIVPNMAPEEPRLVFSAPSTPPLGAEPWYYGSIVVYSLIVLIFSILGVAMGACLLFYASARIGHTSLFALGVCYLLFWFFGVVFMVAMALLFVDMARNLRYIRHQTRR